MKTRQERLYFVSNFKIIYIEKFNWSIKHLCSNSNSWLLLIFLVLSWDDEMWRERCEEWWLFLLDVTGETWAGPPSNQAASPLYSRTWVYTGAWWWPPQSGSHSCPDLCPSCPSSSVMKFNFGKYLTNLIIKYFKIFLNLKILYKPEYNIHSDGKREIWCELKLTWNEDGMDILFEVVKNLSK